MPIKRALLLVVAGLLGVGLTAPISVGDEDVPTAEVLFERAETLYRQLRVVDPEGADASAWSALALAFSEIPERHPASALAGDALWRIGDIHLRRWRAGSSVSADHVRNTWEELVRRYSGNPYAPRALVRLGDLAIAQGRGEEAASRHWYRVLERYPDTEEAALARGRLTGELPPTLPTMGVPDVAAASTGAPASDESRDGSDNLALGDAHPAEGEALPDPAA
ncbi:MAG: tetratricopeptide repeat protein, partial [Acidobacteriota bacterium]